MGQDVSSCPNAEQHVRPPPPTSLPVRNPALWALRFGVWTGRFDWLTKIWLQLAVAVGTCAPRRPHLASVPQLVKLPGMMGPDIYLL